MPNTDSVALRWFVCWATAMKDEGTHETER